MARTFVDQFGAPLANGDRIVLTAHGHGGGPAYADVGTVVGFGRTNVLVEWHAVSYKDHEPHSIPGRFVKKVDPDFTRYMTRRKTV